MTSFLISALTTWNRLLVFNLLISQKLSSFNKGHSWKKFNFISISKVDKIRNGTLPPHAILEIRVLCEMCPNTEFFLVHIFPHLDWIWGDTKYLSVFSMNAGKYGPEKTPYLDTFHVVVVYSNELTKRVHTFLII